MTRTRRCCSGAQSVPARAREATRLRARAPTEASEPPPPSCGRQPSGRNSAVLSSARVWLKGALRSQRQVRGCLEALRLTCSASASAAASAAAKHSFAANQRATASGVAPSALIATGIRMRAHFPLRVGLRTHMPPPSLQPSPHSARFPLPAAAVTPAPLVR
eukprot:SAG11_NODE_2159_length_3730_cov_1.805288_3_plen_162_part_00